MELIIILSYVTLCILLYAGTSYIEKVYNSFFEKGINYDAKSYGEFYHKFVSIKSPYKYNKQYEKNYRKLINKYEGSEIKHDICIINCSIKMIGYFNYIIGFILTGISVYIAIMVDNIVPNMEKVLSFNINHETIYKGFIIYVYAASVVILIKNVRVIRTQYIYLDIANEVLKSREKGNVPVFDEKTIFRKLKMQVPVSNTQEAVIIRVNGATIEVNEGTSKQTIQAVLQAVQSVC